MTDKNPDALAATPAVCYGRVSTGHQTETGYGLSAQRERAEAHCSLAGITATVWIADESVPGNVAPDRRPGLARALATLTVIAAMAELERGLTRRRTTEGLQAAKRAGKRLGRPPSPHTRTAGARVAALRADGLAWRAIPAALDAEGLPAPTAHNAHGTYAQHATPSPPSRSTPKPKRHANTTPEPVLRVRSTTSTAAAALHADD